jgi:hypothetical protein
MSAHLTERELLDFVTHTLPPPQIAMAARHLAACPTCAAAARAGYDVDAATRSVLTSAIEKQRGPRRRGPIFALAAALAVCIGLAAWLTRTPPPPARPPAPDRWSAVVASARVRGSLPIPDVVRALRPSPGVLRGGVGAATRVRLWPAGVVVESDQPQFHWDAVPGATSYRIVVVHGTVIVDNTLVTQTVWTPSRPLERGATYSWQVIAGDLALPAPPDPPALFRVLSRAEEDTITAARRARPGDHLLLGILSARAGLADVAEAELAAYAAAHPNDRAAQSLWRSVQDWPARP